MKSAGRLTKKQQRFCEAMIETNYNQTQAYAIAFPDANETTCRTNSRKVMNVPGVREYIDELTKEAFKNALITPERILRDINNIAQDPEATRAEKTKALELLGKFGGLAQLNVKADVNANVNMIEIGIDDGTDEDAD